MRHGMQRPQKGNREEQEAARLQDPPRFIRHTFGSWAMLQDLRREGAINRSVLEREGTPIPLQIGLHIRVVL